MIGRKLRNRYEIKSHLGDGATATVYRAVDTRLGRDVALKVLLPQVRETARQRFFQEATAAAQLNHPNIMAIYDVDEEGSDYFLVVEYVDGDSLSDFIPSTPDKVVDLGSQIARALAYAHSRDIIHRDVKPANIKVTPDGHVKLMDLGLALPREGKRMTAEGMIIGTPAYLSPEQAQGLPLDSRTDIYSLGIVLYEMATGQLPFDSDDIPALLLQQVKQAPPPLRSFIPNFPIGLENVILKSLEKSPSKRFQTADAFASALQAALAPVASDPANPVPQVSAGPNSRATAFVSKHTLRVVLADDHTLMRKSLAAMLEASERFIIVGEAANGDDALAKVKELLPDVLVLDLNMPVRSGLEALPDIRAAAPAVKVLVLTGRNEDWYIMQALRAGAHGYILKSAEENDLIEAVEKVTQGHLVLGEGVAEKVVTGLLGGGGQSDKLTETERMLLLHVAAGLENDQISRRLGISMTQLIEVLASAMNKLGARDRSAAALQALQRGYILLDELHAITS